MPYSEHGSLETPNDNAQIWRYMGFSKFAWMLKTKQIHFHRVGDFSDPYEGTLPTAYEQLLEKSIEEQKEDIPRDHITDFLKAHEIPRGAAFVNSWHMNDYESAAMWDLYGPEGKSIAIRSTVGELKSAVGAIEKPIHLGSVSYVDFYSEWENLPPEDKYTLSDVLQDLSGNILAPAILKRKEFEHEDEVRLLFTDFDNLPKIDDKIALNTGVQSETDYYNHSINLSTLVDEIVVAPDSPSWIVPTIKEMVQDSDVALSPDDVRESEMIVSD